VGKSLWIEQLKAIVLDAAAGRRRDRGHRLHPEGHHRLRPNRGAGNSRASTLTDHGEEGYILEVKS